MTRADALQRLHGFAPHMGADYAAGRNFDLGARSVVSRLSPYLRRRLITEAEVVRVAYDAHGAQAAKFIDEVIWRSYFKGWLELRPGIWRDYRDGLAADLASVADPARLKAVMAGQSGLACMDAWTTELVQTGYLHNHARMWYASIWVFVLGLPWRLGADFFYRHLLDGDAASNTLGWRWVAGLHTPGKTYHAAADNIATFTRGRFTPSPAELAVRFAGPEGDLPPTSPLRQPLTPDLALPSLLLLTDEDCCPGDFSLERFDIRGAVALTGSHLRSPWGVSPMVQRAEAAALVDTIARLGLPDTPVLAAGEVDLAGYARGLGAVQIVTPYIPTGPLRDWVQASGLPVAEWRRDWDSMIWPDCTAGFFKIKTKIPKYLTRIGVSE